MGKVRKRKDLDRGPMVLHDEEAWRQRIESFIKGRLKWVFIALGIFAVGMMAFLAFVGIGIGLPGMEMLAILLVISTLVILLILNIVWLSFWRLRRLPAMGLYERGLQYNPYIFIPYVEISDVTLPETTGWYKGLVSLEPRTPMTGWMKWNYGGKWRMYRDILGDEGLTELEGRVKGPDTPEGPPRLVLYPRAGSRE
jgi:hypothetical protein